MKFIKSLYASYFGRGNLNADIESGHTPLSLASPFETQGKQSNCIFCGASKANGFNVVWEDESYTVFTDRDPAAAHHLLVIPKRHVDNIKSLTAQDADMVSEMAAIGHRILDELKAPPASRRLGFHIPPFFSVNHLHMHAQGLPYRSAVRALKYYVSAGSRGHDKGFSWFCEVGQAVHILENGGKVGVFPS
ncbi:HIT-like domain-containing protein [Rhodofomes roseus]|uniref:HIT-like domain-containing protein n=1 Tax=Rhodofomes roseus TaxID=34475 RepID=A0ABQ8KKF2_9APHY|nr:HIT-like domain-containing protein [Rhodofomes roseus]KAH9838629.1 HIT-like domain-containing protein [Rhodofomes roseus]